MIPDDSLPIFASANEWFAFYNREYYYFYLIDEKPEIKECYLIIEDNFRNHPQFIPDRFDKQLLMNEFTFNDELFQIYHLIDDNF
jgi:hypothetical protein